MIAGRTKKEITKNLMKHLFLREIVTPEKEQLLYRMVEKINEPGILYGGQIDSLVLSAYPCIVYPDKTTTIYVTYHAVVGGTRLIKDIGEPLVAQNTSAGEKTKMVVATDGEPVVEALLTAGITPETVNYIVAENHVVASNGTTKFYYLMVYENLNPHITRQETELARKKLKIGREYCRMWETEDSKGNKIKVFPDKFSTCIEDTVSFMPVFLDSNGRQVLDMGDADYGVLVTFPDTWNKEQEKMEWVFTVYRRSTDGHTWETNYPWQTAKTLREVFDRSLSFHRRLRILEQIDQNIGDRLDRENPGFRLTF